MTDYAAKREPGINPPKSGALTEVRWIKRLPQSHERNRTDVLYPCVHPVQLKQVPGTTAGRTGDHRESYGHFRSLHPLNRTT
jgi:hypothetical protein